MFSIAPGDRALSVTCLVEVLCAVTLILEIAREDEVSPAVFLALVCRRECRSHRRCRRGPNQPVSD
jgi:hypothetical protein